MEMLRAEALPGSKGLTRLHLEMRLPCPVWGAMNVTGPVKAWSLAAEPPQVRALLCHRAVPVTCEGLAREGLLFLVTAVHLPHFPVKHASLEHEACISKGIYQGAQGQDVGIETQGYILWVGIH